MIATNPTTSPFVLEQLADECSSISTLEHIAANQNTPGRLLAKLARHSNAHVRSAVAENRNTPIDCLMTLAMDEDPDVRFELAENHHLPVSILKTLAQDDNPYVACRAEKTLTRLSEEAENFARSTWKVFRMRQLEKRMNEIESGNLFHTVNRFFNNLGKCVAM